MEAKAPPTYWYLFTNLYAATFQKAKVFISSAELNLNSRSLQAHSAYYWDPWPERDAIVAKTKNWYLELILQLSSKTKQLHATVPFHSLVATYPARCYYCQTQSYLELIRSINSKRAFFRLCRCWIQWKIYRVSQWNNLRKNFYVLLTVHLSIILAINQLNAQILLL